MDERPTHLDLFSGIGGFALAAQWAGFRTIGFCEIDKYCQKVLAKNFLAQPHSAGSSHRNALHKGRSTNEGRRESISQNAIGQNGSAITDNRAASPIFPNIFDLNGRDFAGVSLITGGFPCQPFSVAGKRRGAADDRAIWPEMFRVISEARPAWVLGENVPGIIPMELDNVLSDLEGIGYTTRAFVIGACCVDAKHRRRRVWIIARRIDAHANIHTESGLPKHEQRKVSGSMVSDTIDSSDRTWGGQNQKTNGIPRVNRETLRGGLPGGTSEELSNTDEQGLEGQRKQPSGTGTQLSDISDHCRWITEPNVGRVAHGIPKRVDRLKGLGNAIVPQVAFELLREIRKLI